MAYLSVTDEDRRAMLSAVGVNSVQELFAGIPDAIKLQRPLKVPPALSELELTQQAQALAAMNSQVHASFLGGGAYDHFVPAVVDHLAGRTEFYTSYTPYQPEASQGNLQAFFEYQTLIAQLTGMDVSNASVYDGGSAVTEAVLMALHATGRNEVIVPASMHPEYRAILATYLANLDVKIRTIGVANGTLMPDDLAAAVNPQTACVVVQHPNFFGCLEATSELAEVAHRAGALYIAAFDPISLGLLKRPGDYGADIAVAEGQSLGSPLSFGGPYLGILACREEFVRRMPGRIAGQTVDQNGRRCWVLTLQTREQHIRREKANSNICTNQGLLALRATVYLAAMGPQGLREAANLCVQKAAYASERISLVPNLQRAFAAPVFKEFVVRDIAGSLRALLRSASTAGVLAGLPLGKWYPELSDCFLVSVTEKTTKQQIDDWAGCLAQLSHVPVDAQEMLV